MPAEPPARAPEPAPEPTSTGLTITETPVLSDKAIPAWLLPVDACPAEIAPSRLVASHYVEEKCDEDPLGCLSRCEHDSASACYAAALQAQPKPRSKAFAEALFLRACKLGVASGCTNRAAGMLVLDPPSPERDACTTLTFAHTCREHDPWGCTMYGQALFAGRGAERDLPHALLVLRGGCEAGEDDPACEAAHRLEEMIRSLLPGPSKPAVPPRPKSD